MHTLAVAANAGLIWPPHAGACTNMSDSLSHGSNVGQAGYGMLCMRSACTVHMRKPVCRHFNAGRSLIWRGARR